MSEKQGNTEEPQIGAEVDNILRSYEESNIKFNVRHELTIAN